MRRRGLPVQPSSMLARTRCGCGVSNRMAAPPFDSIRAWQSPCSTLVARDHCSPIVPFTVTLNGSFGSAWACAAGTSATVRALIQASVRVRGIRVAPRSIARGTSRARVAGALRGGCRRATLYERAGSGTDKHMLRAAVVLAVVAAALGAAAPASANSKIVYVCGVNLCKVDVDSAAQTQLTNDGTAESPYRSPSLTADGNKLAFGRGPSGYPYPDLFATDGDAKTIGAPIKDSAGDNLTGYRVIITPDGSGLAYLHIRTCAHPTVATCFEPSTAAIDGSNAGPVVTSQTSYTDVGLGPDGLLTSDTTGDRQFICLLLPPGGATEGCSRAVAAYPGYDLSVPAVSPDGTLVAAEYGCFGGGCSAGTGIALFNYA